METHDDMDTLVGLPGFIMRHTPNVERVAIRQAQVDSSTMQVMTQLSHLKNVELTVDHLEKGNDVHDITSFLNHHKSLGTQSTLERLHIYTMDTDVPSAPFYGIELSNLRELCIQTDFPLTTRHVNDLKRVAETCPNVTSLSLQAEDKIIDRVMGCLQHFQNLKELHVTAEKISQKGAMKCMYCRHLQELELSCLNDLRNVFDVLRMQIPKVYSSVY